LRTGQTLLATADAYPGETITGRVAKLDTRVDERTRAITARAEFPNSGGKLKPGMLVRVGISRGQRTNPAAPESAVSVQGEGAFVYVVQQRPAQGGHPAGATVEQRPIVTGVRQQGFVEIVDGLRPGERIVADGLNKVQPGQAVRISPRPSAIATAGGSGGRDDGGAAPAASGGGPGGPRAAQ
jgi:membrane fusion protein (multidrug efflux system)